MAHTKGQWERTKKGSDGMIFIYSPDNGTVALVVEDMIEQEANADFIAGAPDLYNSVKQYIKNFLKVKDLGELLMVLELAMLDTRQKPWEKYVADHEVCLEKARVTWPCTDSQLRAPMRGVAIAAHANYQHQKIMVIDCLTKKGYRVLDKGELWYY